MRCGEDQESSGKHHQANENPHPPLTFSWWVGTTIVPEESVLVRISFGANDYPLRTRIVESNLWPKYGASLSLSFICSLRYLPIRP